MDGRTLTRAIFATACALAAVGGTAHAQAPADLQLGIRADVHATTPVTPDREWTTAVEAVADPATNQVVVAWGELGSMAENAVVRAVRLDASGTAVGAPRDLSGFPANAMDPDLAFEPGAGALVVARAGDAIWAQRLGTDLAPQGAAFVVAAATADAKHFDPEVAYDPRTGGWLVLWRANLYDGVYSDGQELRARPVSASGALGGVQTIEAAGYIPEGLNLAAGEGGVALAWTRSSAGYWAGRPAAMFRRLAASGAPAGAEVVLSQETPPDSGGYGAYHPDLVWDGARWTVAWAEDTELTEETVIRASRIEGSAVVGSTVLGQARGLPDNVRVDIAAQPARDEILVAWHKDEKFSARGMKGSTGALLDSGPGVIFQPPEPDWYWWATYRGGAAPVPGGFLFVSDRHNVNDDDPDRRHHGLWGQPVAFGRAPKTTITGGPGATHRSPNAAVSFTSSIAGSTFGCNLIVGAIPGWEHADRDPCTSPWALTLEPRQSYAVNVRATSADGWTDASPAVRTFVTDDFDPPVAQFAWTPPRMTTARWGHFEFVADEPATTFTCRLDGGAEFACDSGVVDIEDLALGEHVFRVTPTENGATGATIEFRWTVFTIEQAGERGVPVAPAAPPPPPVTSAAPSVRVPSQPAKVTKRKVKRCTKRSKAKRCVAQRKLAAKKRAAARKRKGRRR